ncbi:4-diphosphocytidyl-2C-methyl-D-erythritol kinase [Hylemonella gracilis str. Niagara R]|uniref:4-diphosphocytidyl-2-C-methyl-D-erythritol kinase n=1 Tax=Hylemonella gracilis str. Niagara R TaxID=1458275 RepID=A0A016XLU8_9BURK|nr:4-(cytidine 5'-diphospho)-2-C-methyl-D-erythritol kinase [Hylemonella gracilis]EYC52527.1 4-diphosphocytidyl-2C-methyl-D-erythritol kinase [Hylemonella gracilis str. Niagara R]
MPSSLHDVSAPAKLNLFLHVTGRRADGYHLLQSVFSLIDWTDTLHFEARPHRQHDGGLSREDLTTPLPADDLVLRAARALQAATGHAGGAHIAIAKHIPAQAGLGGGSSDAATTLLALNRLWKLKLGLKQLSAIGLTLGADVPYFLHAAHAKHATAWVEGVGERLTPLPTNLEPARLLPGHALLVVKPEAGLETAAIFRDPALKRDSFAATITGFAADSGVDSASVENSGDLGREQSAQRFRKFLLEEARNDLQPVAQRLCPGVTQALEWLNSLGLPGRMTGSGSAVFAWVSPDMHVRARFSSTAIAVPDRMQIRWCSSLDIHPLAHWA